MAPKRNEGNTHSPAPRFEPPPGSVLAEPRTRDDTLSRPSIVRLCDSAQLWGRLHWKVGLPLTGIDSLKQGGGLGAEFFGLRVRQEVACL